MKTHKQLVTEDDFKDATIESILGLLDNVCNLIAVTGGSPEQVLKYQLKRFEKIKAEYAVKEAKGKTKH